MRENNDALGQYLARQMEWSERTFGPGFRVNGIIKHIQSELDEIRNDPRDLVEWVDVIILALDGFWRAGGLPETIMPYLDYKQGVNFVRKFPMPTSEDEPSFHEKAAGE